MSLAVRCRGLKKSFFTEDVETKALRGVDIDINAGELFMLVGPSGCGKTTLISIIAAILSFDQGDCEVLGRSLHGFSSREKARFRGTTLGFVFQAYNLIPTLSVVENVSIPLLLHDVPKNEATDRAKAALKSVGLEYYFNHRPNNMSGGQQQRVAIARALVHEPQLIVCDEPTSALDMDTGHQVMEIFEERVRSSGKTLIIVTHDSRIFSFADRIGVMNDGVVERIVDSPHELEHA